MNNQKLVFKLVEVKSFQFTSLFGDHEVIKGFKTKWVTGEYKKSEIEIAGFKDVKYGKQMTYYMNVTQKPDSIEVGDQDGSIEQVIEHFYDGNGVWLPVDFQVKTNISTKKETLGYEFKNLIAL